MRRLLRLIALLSALLLPVLPAAAEEAALRPSVIVVDSSGSMAAALGGATKLDAARDVLGALLSRWPETAPVALIAYGHRRTGDCGDIEVLAPLGPPDPAALVRRLQDLRARGKTPLAASLQLAAGLLPDGGGIVLVTDGLETCGADPCALAKALGASAISVQVVGFGVTEQEAAELACIAEAGGGTYRTADDAAALLDSLSAVAEAARGAPPPEPPPPEPPAPAPASPAPESPPPEPAALQPPAAQPLSVALRAVYAGSGQPLELPLRWQVTATDDGAPYAYEGESRALSLELLPGRYEVTASAANAVATLELEVADQPLALDLPLAVGRLAATVVIARGGTPLDESDRPRWALLPLDGQAPPEAPTAARPSLLLAAGRYRLAVSVQDWTAAVEIAISSGATLETALSLALGGLTLEAALDDEAAALTEWRGLDWQVATAAGQPVAARSGEAAPHLLLPAGDYRVELRVAGGLVAQAARVVEGEERSLRLLVPSADYLLTAALAPGAEPFTDWRDSLWSVTALDALGVAPGSSVMELQPANNPEVRLLPGRWRVTLQSGLTSAEREITAVPGERALLRVDLAAARLAIAAAPAPGGAAAQNVVFEVAPLAADGTAGETIGLGGSSGEMSTILPAGRWRVVAADEQGRRAEQTLALQPGDEQILRLELR